MSDISPGWQEMDTAPRDGTQVLLARHNGVCWDYYTAFWTGIGRYPWQGDVNAYPDSRMDYWQPIVAPHPVNIHEEMKGAWP